MKNLLISTAPGLVLVWTSLDSTWLKITIFCAKLNCKTLNKKKAVCVCLCTGGREALLQIEKGDKDDDDDDEDDADDKDDDDDDDVCIFGIA